MVRRYTSLRRYAELQQPLVLDLVLDHPQSLTAKVEKNLRILAHQI